MKNAHKPVLDFVSKHVIGKAVVAAPIETTTDGSRMTSAYEEDVVFSGLGRTDRGFSFDMTTLARGTRYAVDKNGSRLLAEGTLNTVRVLRYEMTERASTGELIGFSRFISSTNTQPDPMQGAFFLVRMWMERDALVVTESQVGYADFIGADEKMKPFAIDGKYRYAVENGKLTVEYEQATFDVDPKTLERKRTADKFPVQVSREVQFPPALEAA
jgi:hypothetical protein